MWGARPCLNKNTISWRDRYNDPIPPFGLHQTQRWKAAQGIEDSNERRRALELAARDARYFSERLASAILRPEPESVETVAFGHRVTILRDGERRQRYRIVSEDEADPRAGTISYVAPLARRLIGKRVGDIIDMDGHDIEILEIA